MNAWRLPSRRGLCLTLVILGASVPLALAALLITSLSVPAGYANPPTNGAMAVDCDASTSGVQTVCTYYEGFPIRIQIHVTQAPPAGYFAFQAKLRWTDAVVHYEAAQIPWDEAIWPNCGIPARIDNRIAGEPSLLFGCVPFPPLLAGSTFTGAVAEFEMSCKPPSTPDVPAQTALTLVARAGDAQLGTHFLDHVLNPVDPAVAPATILCAPIPTAGDSLTGPWTIHTDEPSMTCPAVIAQLGTSLSGSLHCENFVDGSLSGIIDPQTGSFILLGEFFLGTSVLSGSLGSDGLTLTGTWDLGIGIVSTFSAVRSGAPPPDGLMALDCDTATSGVQTACTYEGGEAFNVDVYIEEPPSTGYAGFQAKLRWPDSALGFPPPMDPSQEVLWPDCGLSGQSTVDLPGSAVTRGCLPSPLPSSPFTKTGAMLRFRLQCLTHAQATTPNELAFMASTAGDPVSWPADVHLTRRPGDAQQGTHFLDINLGAHDPELRRATVTCTRDLDRDGCMTEQEEGADPPAGGERDPHNFWDFFDTPDGSNMRDAAVTAADIARVVQRFGAFDIGLGAFDRFSDPLSAPDAPVTPAGDRANYHPAFDRSSAPPALSGPADGVIATGDIALMVAQFGHSCAGG
ncbi:MAG: flexitail domain-containing putative surface protein [Dehalococcoidia bacterium]